jgi:putative acetyltransferase
MVIIPYTDFSHVTGLRKLIQEYMSTLPFAIDYQSPEKELEDLGALYGEANRGAMFVAHIGNEYAGCVALKDLGDNRCEMKRLYVRPQFRGKDIGRKLADAIVMKAKELGYAYMYLDTHREAQKQAIEMYKRMGFVECEDYHPNPGKLLCLRLELLQ